MYRKLLKYGLLGRKVNGGNPVFPTGMVARWTLDNDTDGYIDLINGLTLTETGTGVSTEAGVINNAADFNGNGYLAAPDSTNIRLAAGTCIECWFKPTTTTGAYGIAAKYDFAGFSDEYGLFQNNDNVGWRVFDTGFTPTTIFSGDVLDIGVWVHIVGAVHTDLTLRIYINGVQVETSSPIASLANPAVRLDFALGNISSGIAPLTGRIDESAIYQFGESGDPGASFWLERYNDGLGIRP